MIKEVRELLTLEEARNAPYLIYYKAKDGYGWLLLAIATTDAEAREYAIAHVERAMKAGWKEIVAFRKGYGDPYFAINLEAPKSDEEDDI